MKIGDALYALYASFDDGTEQIMSYPVVSVTDRYVYVNGILDRHQHTRFRLDRAELEAEGCAYSRPLNEILHVRPSVNWPLMVVAISTPALTGRTA